MRMTLTVLAVAALATFVKTTKAQTGAPRPLRPVHTFSIVARDPATGEMGVAVQSHWFSVGSNVAWAEAGVPDNVEMVYWHAVALANMNRVEEALPLFRRVFAADPNWRTLTPRLVKAGILPDNKELIDRIINVGRRAGNKK